MEERVEPRHVKIVGDDGGIPMDFAFWIQLHKVSDTDTRMRLVLHIELNMMMKMMIGGKLQKAVDQIAEGIANALNGRHRPGNAGAGVRRLFQGQPLIDRLPTPAAASTL